MFEHHGWAHGQYFYVLWYPRCGDRKGETLVERVSEPIDLIAEDARFGAKDVGIAEIGPIERPVIGPINGEAPRSARCETAPIGVHAIVTIHADRGGSRPIHRWALPCAGR